MRIHRLVLICALTIFCCLVHAREPNLSSVGFGNLRFGMPIQQAEMALGTSLVKMRDPNQGGRYPVLPKRGYVGLSFTVSESGVIDGVYLYNSKRYKTDRNVGIGSTANDIWGKYGAEVEAKSYKCANDFLIFTYRDMNNPDLGVVYTISDRGVEGLMAGYLTNWPTPC
jgi:hypothetical protein